MTSTVFVDQSTPIVAAWLNDANTVTYSIFGDGTDYSGNLTMPASKSIIARDGTVGAPGITFNGDTDTGVYRIGANNLGVAVNGAKVLDVSTTGLGVTGTLSTTGAVTVTGGTVTTSTPTNDITQTWNAGGVTFTGWKMNITDTASAAGSLLFDYQVGGVSIFSITKAGVATLSKAQDADTVITVQNSNATTSATASLLAKNNSGNTGGFLVGSTTFAAIPTLADRLGIYTASLAGISYVSGKAGGDHRWFAASTGSEAMRLDTTGLGIGTTAANKLHALGSAADYTAAIDNSHASTPFGMRIRYTGATPNGTGNSFLVCTDGTLRAEIRSNGGLANFSANNVNLSDRRLKTNIVDAPSYYERWKQLQFRTFLYKDQTDSELNLGVVAQELEAVCPELIDNSGYGETPADGVPLKTVYQTDFQYATAKALQEAIVQIENLKNELASVKAQLANK